MSKEIAKRMYYDLRKLDNPYLYKETNCLISKRFRKNHPDKIRKEKREWKKEQKEKITNYYIKSLLVQKSKLKHKDLPIELINLKKQQIKINRLIKN